MQHVRSAISLSVMLVLLGFAAACERSPLGPGSVEGSRQGDAGPAPSDIQIIGPESVAPGGSAQLRAIAHFPESPARDVTNAVEWSTSSPNVIGVSPTGIVTARERGEATIRVFLRGTQASRPMLALPMGTYRLSGSVHDAGGLVVGARVQILSGAGAGLFATTEDGQYRIYGVAGDTRVQVTMPDYEADTQMIDINQHQTLDFQLRPMGADRGQV